MSFENQIRQFCASHGLELKKSLGQNFLVDEEVLSSIIETADIQSDDHVLEIGAGIGILTKELMKKAGKVTSVEIDERAVELLPKYLEASFETISNCHTEGSERSSDRLEVQQFEIPQDDNRVSSFCLIHANTLETPFPDAPYKIVANIPYHITSALLHKAFVEEEVKPSSVTLMIQKEVAEKICTDTDGSRLTILVKLFGTPNYIRTVDSACFLPPPKVQSAVIHIESHSEPIADNQTIEKVFTLTKAAFGQRRKMLRNTVDTSILEAANIDPTRRPQTLSVEEWIALARVS